MFILKKCISAALLPPGVFILILIFAAWWFKRLRRPLAACNALLFALLIWALSTTAMAHMLIGSLEDGLAIPSRPRGDVIVLLGGGIYDKVQDMTGRGAPSDSMMARIVTAVRLQRQLEVPILVSGGEVYAGLSAEAPIARRFLQDLGVPARQILTEEKSRDTVENARFCKVILKEHNFRQPLLITSAFHMKRSMDAFRRQGVSVVTVPANFIAAKEHKTILADLLPDAGALHGSATALREYLGLLFYRLGGQKG